MTPSQEIYNPGGGRGPVYTKSLCSSLNEVICHGIPDSRKLQDGDKLSVFLTRGDENYSVEAGQMIDKTYRIEKVTEAAVVLTYLPLGVRQTLQIQAGN